MQENTTSNNTEPVTLNELAAMVARGFDNMNTTMTKRFDELEQKINQRPTLEQVDLKFQNFRNQIDLKLTNMENRLTENLGDKPMERDRVLNIKTDTVASKLGNKALFSPNDVQDIERISPFAINQLNQ